MKKSIFILYFISLIGALSSYAQQTIHFSYDAAGNRTAASSTGYSNCQQSIHILTPLSMTTDMYYSNFIHIETQVLSSAQSVNLTAGNYVLADQPFEVPMGVEAILQTEVRECLCYDGLDNDGDGLADSNDPDCL